MTGWAFVVWLGALAVSAMAQTSSTGALAGTLTDPSGSAAAGALATLVNLQSGQERTTATGSDGVFRFALLPPATYRLTFSAAGFRTSELLDLQVVVTET